MASKWIDVTESDWYYNEIVEASNVLLEDGEPLVSGIPYNYFMGDAPHIYEEKTGDGTTKKFTLSKKITPKGDSPLFVYVDGIQTLYRTATINTSTNTTEVELYVAPPRGAVISFASYGKPVVDKWGYPKIVNSSLIRYPSWTLTRAATYFYDQFSRQFYEYFYAFGRTLKRAPVPDSDWSTMTPQAVARKWIGYSTDTYCVSPGGVVYAPYNLNNVTCRFYYSYIDENGIGRHGGGALKPISSSIIYTNRFFPGAYITRGDAYSILNRLRKSYFSRFTDMEAPVSEEAVSENFWDVGRDTLMKEIPAGDVHVQEGHLGDADWVRHILELEKEVLDDGTPLVKGLKVTNIESDGMTILVDSMKMPLPGPDEPIEMFLAESHMTRAQAVSALNTFRKWAIERFKR